VRAIQAVIVTDLARLSRTWLHLRLLADECTDAEVTVHVVQAPGMPAMDDLRGLMHDTGVNGGREEPCDDSTA
jgi:DNA invertase Pin-like site-specific DNA recombinase